MKIRKLYLAVLAAIVSLAFWHPVMSYINVAGIDVHGLSHAIESEWGCPTEYKDKESWYEQDTSRLYVFKCNQEPDREILHEGFDKAASEWVEANQLIGRNSVLLSPIGKDPESTLDDRWAERSKLMTCRSAFEVSDTSTYGFIPEFVTVCIDSVDEPHRVYLRTIAF